MAKLEEGVLRERLRGLTSSQTSIETASLYVLHHKDAADSCANVWLSELKAAKMSRKLAYMYLANDVLQGGKTGIPSSEFNIALSPILGDAISIIKQQSKSEDRERILRILDIWQQRSIFKKPFISRLRKITEGKLAPAAGDDGALLLELKQTAASLAESSVADGEVMTEVAKLPDEVFDVEAMWKIQSGDEGDRIKALASHGSTLLAKHSGRLAAELEDRNNLVRTITALLDQHRKTSERTVTQIADCDDRLARLGQLETAVKAVLPGLPKPSTPKSKDTSSSDDTARAETTALPQNPKRRRFSEQGAVPTMPTPASVVPGTTGQLSGRWQKPPSSIPTHAPSPQVQEHHYQHTGFIQPGYYQQPYNTSHPYQPRAPAPLTILQQRPMPQPSTHPPARAAGRLRPWEIGRR